MILFGCKRKKTDHGMKLHNEELYYLYSSLNIVMTIIARIMKRAGHVARIGEMRRSTKLYLSVR
jgi:hypothetical protein